MITICPFLSRTQISCMGMKCLTIYDTLVLHIYHNFAFKMSVGFSCMSVKQKYKVFKTIKNMSAKNAKTHSQLILILSSGLTYKLGHVAGCKLLFAFKSFNEAV